jgi:hypothetical protein
MSFTLLLALKSIYLILKTMIFGPNKGKLNQEAFYLDKDSFEMSHIYKYLGIVY